MEERLKSILEFVNHWLKFAEAKNAALLAASSAVVFGLLKSSNLVTSLPLGLKLYFYSAIGVISFSVVLCLLSFIPRTRLPWIGSTRRPTSEDNLLFYGDIAGYDAPSYLEAISRKVGIEDFEPSGLEQDYAEQIIINSRISLMKYRLFSAAVWFTLSAFLTPIVTLPLFLIRRSSGSHHD